MSDIKFKFSKGSQRKLNLGHKIDPAEELQRKKGRTHYKLKINLPMGYLRNMDLPMGINMIRYKVKDVHGNIIPPFTKEYDKAQPVICSFICSEVHPLPLCRWTEDELVSWLEKTFGKKIIDWNVKEKEEPGIAQVLFRHEGMMENNLVTGQDNINKNMFNVREKFVYEHELNWLNDRLEVFGTKLKTNDALKSSEKTINTPRKYYFEYGDW